MVGSESFGFGGMGLDISWDCGVDRRNVIVWTNIDGHGVASGARF